MRKQANSQGKKRKPPPSEGKKAQDAEPKLEETLTWLRTRLRDLTAPAGKWTSGTSDRDLGRRVFHSVSSPFAAFDACGMSISRTLSDYYPPKEKGGEKTDKQTLTWRVRLADLDAKAIAAVEGELNLISGYDAAKQPAWKVTVATVGGAVRIKQDQPGGRQTLEKQADICCFVDQNGATRYRRALAFAVGLCSKNDLFQDKP